MVSHRVLLVEEGTGGLSSDGKLRFKTFLCSDSLEEDRKYSPWWNWWFFAFTFEDSGNSLAAMNFLKISVLELWFESLLRRKLFDPKQSSSVAFSSFFNIFPSTSSSVEETREKIFRKCSWGSDFRSRLGSSFFFFSSRLSESTEYLRFPLAVIPPERRET